MSGPLVKCPHCEHQFENKKTEDPLGGFMSSFMSGAGMSQGQAGAVSSFLGREPEEFECPSCGRRFKI